MSQLDLPQRYLPELLALLQAHVPAAEIWAYGSRVNGSAHDTSDLDLVLRNPGDPLLPQTNLSRLREALSASNLPILVDVLDWARIPDTFRAEIERAHVVLRDALEETRS